MALATNGKSHNVPLATGAPGNIVAVESREDLDPETAERIRAWLRWKKGQLGIARSAMAVMAEVDPSTLTKFMNGDRPSISLGVFARLHRGLSMDATAMLDGYPPGHRRNPPPASPSPEPERQRRIAGK